MCFSYIFPDEILLIIFNLCDSYTLLRINRVCKQFYRVAYTILNERVNNLLVTNQMSKKFRERCKPLLSSYKSKFFTHDNWTHGIYKKRKIYSSPFDLYTISIYKGLQMTEHMIWLCYDRHLFAFDRSKDGSLKKNTFQYYCDCLFVDIVHCNNEIISSHGDGSIRHWKIVSQNKRSYLLQLKIHENVHFFFPCLDATLQNIISGSKGFIKIQKNIIHENDDSVQENQIFYRNKQLDMLSLAFDPTGTKFAASALYLHSSNSSLLIFDINTKSYPLMDKKDVIFRERKFYPKCRQLLWENSNTILICNRQDIKKMDIRTSKVVRTWNVSNKQFLSSFSSDNLYTIITATNNGNIILWDQRQSSPIQMYNMDENNGYIYSVQFDSSRMYAAGIQHVIEYSFKPDL